MTRAPTDSPAAPAAGSRRGWGRYNARDAGVRRWYVGSLWGLPYLGISAWYVWTGLPTGQAVAASAMLLLVGVAFVLVPPTVWGRGVGVAALVLAGFVVLIGCTSPFLGVNTVWLLIFPAVAAGFCWLPSWFFLSVLAALMALEVVVLAVEDAFGEYWFVLVVTVAVGSMMFAFAEQIRSIRRLRAAQHEVARLAVVEERDRFARDMHDVLGHSLTVVNVKAQLAARLVEADPARARAELDDIGALTRSSLADLRATAAGYRQVRLSTELAAARSALEAAEVVAHLPEDVEVVEPRWRELFAWALRETVTNVVRHAQAANCWVELGPERIAVSDDGTSGCAPDVVLAGHGLAGLAERARAAGARLGVAERAGGGSVVAVSAESEGDVAGG